MPSNAQSDQATERCERCGAQLYDATATMYWAHLVLECDEAPEVSVA